MKIHFISLGCDKNLVDSEIMLGLLAEAGHAITDDETAAEVIVINTCGFIADATNEGVKTILEAARQKTEGKCRALVVAGCMVARYRDKIMQELPEVDVIMSPDDTPRIVSVIEKAAGGERFALISDKGGAPEELHRKRLLSGAGHFAYLRVADGCDNRCTYCTIPSIRGAYRSRTADSLAEEAETLAARGVKELILVAQDVALYGADLADEIPKNERLPRLLRRLSAIPGVEWIRLMYCYPEHITPELIGEMASNAKICHYIDMPVQHSADTVLRRMGRAGTNAGLRAVIADLRAAMPDICIRTTLIAGFPGESEEEFGELLNFVREARFDRLGVFAYSREDGTPAYKMKGQLTKPVKERRRKALMKAQAAVSAQKCAALVGRTLRVITDGYIAEDGVWCGRSWRDCPDVDGMVFFACDWQPLTGDFVDVTITSAGEYDLIGEAVLLLL